MWKQNTEAARSIPSSQELGEIKSDTVPVEKTNRQNSYISGFQVPYV